MVAIFILGKYPWSDDGRVNGSNFILWKYPWSDDGRVNGRNFIHWKYPWSDDGRSLQTKFYGHIRFY